MSIEARIIVNASFPDDAVAKKATSQLKKSLKNNQDDLAGSLNVLNSIPNQSSYENDIINVEEISRKKNVLTINSYTYTKEDPVWFAKSISELGANKIFIRGVWGGHGRNFYFIDGEKVSKNKYDGDKPKQPRVLIKARLISTWAVGDIFESTGLQLETLAGEKLYHIGKGQLVSAFYDYEKDKYDTTIEVEFSASIERGKLEREILVNMALEREKLKDDYVSPFSKFSAAIERGKVNGEYMSTFTKLGSVIESEKLKDEYVCFVKRPTKITSHKNKT